MTRVCYCYLLNLTYLCLRNWTAHALTRIIPGLDQLPGLSHRTGPIRRAPPNAAADDGQERRQRCDALHALLPQRWNAASCGFAARAEAGQRAPADS